MTLGQFLAFTGIAWWSAVGGLAMAMRMIRQAL
jgi:hypothetical protein